MLYKSMLTGGQVHRDESIAEVCVCVCVCVCVLCVCVCVGGVYAHYCNLFCGGLDFLNFE